MKTKFRPEDFLIDLVDYNGNTVKYMTNPGRVLAFRLDYPKGRIRVEYQYNPEISSFITTAYIYADASDDLNNYLASDVGCKVFQNDNSLPEAATQAISRALGRCGYGTEYSGVDESGLDGKMTEAGFYPKELLSPPSIIESAEESPELEKKPPLKKKGRKPKNTEEVKEVGEEKKAEEVAEEKEETATKVEENAETVEAAEPVEEKLPLETVLEKESSDADEPQNPETKKGEMTLEEAKKVIIPFGQKKGQFMGEVYATDPNALRWYAEKYAGTNEEVKNAAKVILSAG